MPESESSVPPKAPKFKHISIQLLSRIFSGYLLVALTITSCQIILEYRNEHETLKKQINSISSTFMPTLSEALWNYDEEQITAGIRGMKKIDAIFDVTIETPNQIYRIETETPKKDLDEPFLVSKTPDILYQQFYPITSPNADKETLGRLIIHSSSKTVLSRTYHTFTVTIISALFKTFLLWLIAYYFISRIVRNPINNLSKEINAFDINNLEQESTSINTSPSRNEIDFLKHHFDQLSFELKSKNRALTESHAVLEMKIAERTQYLQQALTDLEKANKVKSNFLCQISHELRTPLNSIIGFSKKIQQRLNRLDDERAKDGITTVISNGEHLLTLVNDLLDSSKAESGKLELNITATSLQPIFKEVLDTLRPSAETKSIQLDIADPPTAAIEADSHRLRQILINLVCNAIKFTEHGHVTVQAYPQKQDNRDGLCFEVKDSGCGIDPEDLSRIFQEFEQLGRDSGSCVVGTGLGLAITRHLVHMHHGNIQVDSEKDAGSTFRVWLPLIQPATHEP